MTKTTARKLPLLNNIRIASPCSESWDGMVGDDKVRFCGGCMKNVYNLSAMTDAEAVEVIEEKEGDLCVRLYRRKDGTVITADCPVGVQRKRVTKVAAAAMAFGTAGVAFGALPAEEPLVEPCEIPTARRTVDRSTPERRERDAWLYSLLDGGEAEARPRNVPHPPEPHIVEMGDYAEPPRPARMGKMALPPRGNDEVPQL